MPFLILLLLCGLSSYKTGTFLPAKERFPVGLQTGGELFISQNRWEKNVSKADRRLEGE